MTDYQPITDADLETGPPPASPGVVGDGSGDLAKYQPIQDSDLAPGAPVPGQTSEFAYKGIPAAAAARFHASNPLANIFGNAATRMANGFTNTFSDLNDQDMQLLKANGYGDYSGPGALLQHFADSINAGATLLKNGFFALGPAITEGVAGTAEQTGRELGMSEVEAERLGRTGGSVAEAVMADVGSMHAGAMIDAAKAQAAAPGVWGHAMRVDDVPPDGAGGGGGLTHTPLGRLPDGAEAAEQAKVVAQALHLPADTAKTIHQTYLDTGRPPAEVLMDAQTNHGGVLDDLVAEKVPSVYTAYHGSPHEFTAFDSSKIGTGEGAQAYGHGFYFAESPDVAISYKNTLADETFRTANGGTFDPSSLEHLNVRNAARKNGTDLDATIEKAQSLLPGNEQTGPMLQRDIAKLQDLKTSGGISQNPGNLYKVGIKGSQANLLDWDKSLSEQSPEVKAALAKSPGVQAALARAGGKDITGSQLLDEMGDAIDRPEEGNPRRHAETNAIVSQQLHDAGIPGIRYLDRQSRGAGEGSRNFVIFNPKDVTVAERNGTPIAPRPTGISKIGQSIEAKAVEDGLTKGFAGTAGYDKITIADQAERTANLINSDLDKARAVIRGDEPLPSGMKGTALITAMEDYIKKNPDADLAYELANSPLVTGTSEAAQEMRLAAERTPDSAAAKLQEIKAAQEKAAGGRAKITQNVTAAKAAAREANSGIFLPKQALRWDKFLDEIKC